MVRKGRRREAVAVEIGQGEVGSWICGAESVDERVEADGWGVDRRGRCRLCIQVRYLQ